LGLADVPVELVARCQRNEEGAFDELFAATREDVYRWIYSMLRHEDDAQEVLQEVYVRIFRHLPRLQQRERFGAWAARLIVNQVNTWRVRAAKARTEQLAEGIDIPNDALPLQGTGGVSPRAAASRKEVLRDVNRAIAELPPRQRTAVLLFDLKGWSIKEIAAELDITEGAVKFNIFQGRRKLRALLGQYVDDKGRTVVDSAE
jgi:RNA polymerase sigma-70 factor (ECF subfamily)